MKNRNDQFTVVKWTVVHETYIIIHPKMVSGSKRGRRIGIRVSAMITRDGSYNIRGINRATGQPIRACISIERGVGTFWYP